MQFTPSAMLVAMGLLMTAGAFADDSKPNRVAIGTKVADFTLHDQLGAKHATADEAAGKPIVLAFLGVECPLAKLYTPRLAELAREFDSKVVFYGVDANRQDAVTEIVSFARRHEVAFPILKDLQQQIADQVGATRTPEIVVLDADRRIRYRGRVDDQFGFVRDRDNANYQKPSASRSDLRAALEELVAGKDVSVAETEVAGCLIGRDREPKTDAEVTYSNQIARILNSNCVFCHRDGQIAPFTLTSYDDAAGWADMIREVVDAERMPPWHADSRYGHFENEARLSDADKKLIAQWVQAGAPEGNAADLPPAPQFTDGWMIPEPEQVIYMADEEYKVPAEGTVEYQHFVVDPGWTEDKWISAIEPRPGNPSVVHHILIFVVAPNGGPRGLGVGDDDFLGAFAPGLRPEPLEKGLARKVPAGSKLIFQMHYTPNGSPQTDRSYLGVVFANPAEVKKQVKVSSAINGVFQIPPGEGNFPVKARYVFKQDSNLLTLMPHMHLRGKAFQYDAIYPDGKREVLLSVPRYDFGWQTNYRLAEPKFMPRGTRLECSAVFDNSEDNLNNPDPTKSVTFGDQTWEEMMIGFFEATPVDQDLTAGRSGKNELSRTEQSLVVLQATGADIDENVKAMSYMALSSGEMFGNLNFVIQIVAPQVDRVCLTTVHDGKITQAMGPSDGNRDDDDDDDGHDHDGGLDAPPSANTIRSPLAEAPAEGSLATIAAGKQPVVFDDLTKAEGAVFETMRGHGVKSSLHIPIEVKGQPATLNFWSKDAAAFPAPVVQLLGGIAEIMKAGQQQAQQAQQPAANAAAGG